MGVGCMCLSGVDVFSNLICVASGAEFVVVVAIFVGAFGVEFIFFRHFL
jgi:hypothetical protein